MLAAAQSRVHRTCRAKSILFHWHAGGFSSGSAGSGLDPFSVASAATPPAASSRPRLNRQSRSRSSHFFCTGDDSANPCVFTSTHEVAESLQVKKMRTPRAGAPVQAWTPPLPQLCLSGPEAALPLETLAFFASAMIRQPHVYSLPHMKVTSRSKCKKMRTCRAGVQVLAWTPPLPLFCLSCDTSRGLPRTGPEPGLPLETFACSALATIQQPHVYALPHLKLLRRSKCKNCERVERECRF